MFLKIKLIYILLYLFYYDFKILNISISEDNIKLKEIQYYLNTFSFLVKRPLNMKDNLIIKEKKNILQMFSNISKKNISVINTIFVNKTCRFGNCLIFLNKFIFYCEIIGCKSIILNKKYFWFIKNNITIKNSNITISVDEYNNYDNFSSLIYDSWDIFFYSFLIKPEIRIHFLRNEILLNLPKIVINYEDLYIHIRGSDIFAVTPHYPYAQPPLCFYKNILKKFKYRNVYIISEDKKNPVIIKLINKFPNLILYINNSIEKDISILVNAYKIVNSMSSFINSIIQLNYNLRFLWEYNIYQITEKIYQYHHDLFKYPHNNFTIFKMDSSQNYKNKMNNWKNKRNQIKLMIKEKCINEFLIIKNEN